MQLQTKDSSIPSLKDAVASSAILTSNGKPQLDALTSLRFFACAAIIYLHSAWFFIDVDFMKNWQLDEGVAFFFVLSGFILTYVYPNLRGTDNIKQFLANRLGRMVPSHVLLTFITLGVLPVSCATAGAFFANLFLIQSWMPRRDYYFGLNAVAWSICVEVFFSFAFVLLIRPWKWGWAGKLVLGLLLTLGACVWAHIFVTSGSHGFLQFNEEYLLNLNPLVRTFDFLLGMATARIFMRFNHLIKLGTWAITFIVLQFNEEYLLNLNPLVRTFDFLLGMATARIFMRFNHLIKLGTWAITFIEVSLISIIMFEITQINNLIENFIPALKSYPSVTYWMVHGGCAPIFAMVIFLMALERGFVAKLFANSMLVWLGEVSYSMYMLHFLLIQSLSFYLPEFGKINWPVMYPIYLAMVVLLSYLNFNLVENPARKIIRKIVSSSKKSPFSFSSLWQFFTPNLGYTLAAGLLSIVLAAGAGAYIVNSQSRFHYNEVPIGNSINFEDYFRLEKVNIASAYDGSKINLTWRSLKAQTVSRSVEISCIGQTENMLEQYEQKDMYPLMLKSGQLFSQTIYMPSSADQRGKWKKLGLRLSIHVFDAKHRHQYRILAPLGGRIDWWTTRLTIPLKQNFL